MGCKHAGGSTLVRALLQCRQAVSGVVLHAGYSIAIRRTRCKRLQKKMLAVFAKSASLMKALAGNAAATVMKSPGVRTITTTGVDVSTRMNAVARSTRVVGAWVLLLPIGHVAWASDEACLRLREAASPGVAVTDATPVGPDPLWWSPRGMVPPVSVSTPFCRVQVRLEGRIGMELWLPTANRWNGRLLGLGVGGDAGVFNYGDMARGLAAGYASVSNDSGHKSSEAHWMMRPEAVADYTHRSQHFMNQAARVLVGAYYGRPAHHAYFLGCSGGGRQALKEAQRFPADYDGVVSGAGAPAMPEMSARHLSQALFEMGNAEGAMTESAWTLVASATVASCDPDDGVVDGVVEDPLLCHFDAAALQCKPGQESGCLLPAQVATVKRFYSPLRDEAGREHDRGLVPGVRTRPGPPSPLLLPMFGEGAHHDMAWKAEQFDMASDLALVDKEMPELRADDPDLRAFADHGGKLILYQGWLDPSVAATYTIDYYEKVLGRLGRQRATTMMRLYMVPGMLHCGGGAGASSFGGAHDSVATGDPAHDVLSAVVDWVENQKPPQAIRATGRSFPGRSRPLCPYPSHAHYKGTGDAEDAASFECR